MALEELAEAALSFAVAVARGDVEVADACVVSGLEELQGVAAARRTHDVSTAEAEAGGLAAGGSKCDLLHRCSEYFQSFR